MRAVMKKMIADLLGRPLQAAVILITLVAAASLIYLGLATVHAATGPFERLRERTDGADAWFSVTGGQAGKELAARIGALEEVIVVTELRPRMSTRALLPNEETPPVTVVAVRPDRSVFDSYLIVQGRDLQGSDQNVGVLDGSFARFWGIGVGDRIRVATLKGPQEVEIIGLHAESRVCQYPNCTGMHLYILPDSFQQIAAGQEDIYWYFGVKLAQPEAADRFVSQARQVDGQGARVADSMSWLRMREVYVMDQVISTVLISIVALAAVATAGLITANIIGGAVLAHYREIGLLKALGFTPAHVLLLFVGQYGLLALLGGTVGSFGGHLFATHRLHTLAANMGDSSLLRYNPTLALLTVTAVVLISALFTALAALRAVRVPPQAAMAQGFSAASASVPPAVRLMAALRLPTSALLGVKDVFTRPGRAALTVLSIVICLITLSLSIGLDRLAQKVTSDPSVIGQNFDLVAVPGLLPAEEAEAVVARLEATDSYYSVAYRSANLPDREDILYLRGLGGRPEEFQFPILAGRMVQGPGEVVLAPIIMDRLGVQLNDRIQVQIGEVTTELTVVGRIRSMDEWGQVGLTLLATLQAISPDAQPREFLLRVKPGMDPQEARRELLEETEYRLAASVAEFRLPPHITGALATLPVLSLLMAGIAMLSVLNAALLTAREHIREVGIRKAIGMTPAQVYIGVGTSGICLGVLGGAVGVPLGRLAHHAVVSTLANIFGSGPLDTTMPVWSLALLFVLGLFIAVLASLPAAVWASRLSSARVLGAE